MLKRFLEVKLNRPYLSLTLVAIAIAYGWYAQNKVAMDAIPDIGQNQVIVLTEWMGQSPKDIEDQITYPLSVSLLSVPKATSVRGKSLFGFSFVQVTFSDDTDYYWARTRVSEQLATVASELPNDAKPRLGPDATGLGQILYYVLKPNKPTDPAALRSTQDYVVKYALQSVDGVAEVASIGGYKREYQVEVDPDQLRYHGVTLAAVAEALRKANREVGAKTLEQSGMEFVVRGRGFLGGGLGPQQTLSDIEQTVVKSTQGVPLRIEELATVSQGTAFRRGGLDLNGAEAVGGIVVMRLGENPRKVIDSVKAKIKTLEPSLDGVKIVPIYDRTDLIDETVATLTDALLHEILITILVILLFLMHLRSSLIVASVLPLAVLMTFVLMRWTGLDANIMSLAGIAIAIGNMVDISIVYTENIYERLAKRPGVDIKERIHDIVEAAVEVTPALLTATATTVISFLPVFLLTGRDFKLFAPLAATKTFALLAALGVSLVVIPLFSRVFLTGKGGRLIRGSVPLVFGLAAAFLSVELMKSFSGAYSQIWSSVSAILGALCGYALGRIVIGEELRSIEASFIAKKIHRGYEPLLRWALAHRRLVLALPLLGLLIGLGSWRFMKSDDWIALDEGSFFYMPTLYPGVSFSQAMTVLQKQDALIKEIPEVKDVLGKIGRADTALDPAPTAMVETYIMLKDKSEWRKGVTESDIWKEVTDKATLPGVTPASFLQPIEGRVVMLQSGIKAAMAIRIFGDTLEGLASSAEKVATQLKAMESVNAATVNPDLVLGKPYIEFNVDRETSARYGVPVAGVNELIATALGGSTVGRTVEGRERYPITLRYQREHRDSLQKLSHLPVVTPQGAQVPLSELANFNTTWGPAGISSENARLVAHVSFAPSGRFGSLETVEDVMSNLSEAQKSGKLALPPGYEFVPVGSFQNQIEANQTLMWVIPLVILVNLFIIYLMFGSWALSLTVFSGIPLAFGGGMLLLFLLGIKINTAVWVGFIALFGIAVDNGVILMSYLKQRMAEDDPKSPDSIIESVVSGAMRRIRPCLMTTTTTIIALVPVLISTGKGAEVAHGMALPIFGGMFSALLVLLVAPVAFYSLELRKSHESA